MYIIIVQKIEGGRRSAAWFGPFENAQRASQIAESLQLLAVNVERAEARPLSGADDAMAWSYELEALDAARADAEKDKGASE